LDEGQKNKAIAAAVGYSAGQVSKIRTWAINGGLSSKAGKLSPSGFEWLSKACKQESFQETSLVFKELGNWKQNRKL